jgi:predicted nucleic acid-binding protein
MTRLIADSSSLILMAKCGLLEIIRDLFEVIIPSGVNMEVASENLRKVYPDAALVSELIGKRMIKVRNPSTAKPTLPLSLHRGEEEALMLASELKEALFVTDDGKAIKAARFLKLPFTITPKIVVELFRLQKLSLNGARQSLEKLSVIGRYSPEIISDAMLSLMEEKHGETNDNKDS